MNNWFGSEIDERLKGDELRLSSDDIDVKLVSTGKRCHGQDRRECVSESIISTLSHFRYAGKERSKRRKEEKKKTENGSLIKNP